MTLLTVAQAAEVLGLSEYQIRQEVARGVLPCRRPGGRLLRFTQADLDTYVERIASTAQAPAAGLTAGSRRRRRTA